MRFCDPVFIHDRISTGEKSIVRLLLGGKAVVTARELSVLTINEESLRSTVILDSGKVGASVLKDRMKPGERPSSSGPQMRWRWCGARSWWWR